MRLFPFFLAIFIGLGTLHAQEFSFGFKAGLNFSKINGPSETDGNDSSLEGFNQTKGFHFGPIFNLKLTDLFRLRAEMLYSQKGVDYSYVGQSFWIFYPEVGDVLYHSGGNRNMRLITSNAYLDIPVMAVVRIGRVEASAGINLSLLLSSKATGEVTYTGANIDPFTIALEYNFGKDEPTTSAGEDPQIKNVGSQSMMLPRTTGAYYGIFGRDDNLYNSIDLGVNAGISFYLSQGLFVGVRMNYGLTDVTNEKQDVSAARLSESDKFILRNDIDKNVSLQASVGFSF